MIPYTDGIHFNLELERSIIGSCLIEPAAYETICGIVSLDCFFHNETREVFEAMSKMWVEGYALDLVSISTYLYQKGTSKIQGKATGFYLAELTQNIVNISHLPTWCLMLKQIYAKREILKVTYIGAKMDKDPFEQAAEIEKTIRSIFEIKNADTWKDLSVIGIELLHHIEAVERGEIEYISTGIAELDKLNGGFRGGNLIVIGARPSVGKSALMGKIALANALKGKKVGIIPLEMDNKDVHARLVSLHSGIEHWKIDRAKFTERERQIVYQKISDMSELPIRMSDATDVNIIDIRMKAGQLKRQYGLDLLIIDYLQLIGTDKSKNKNREQEVAELSRGLKLLAMKENIPVIILAQLNRQSVGRQDKKPSLADLRESGAIEQDADGVMLLHRDDMVGILQDSSGNSTDGQADLIIAKWRNGATMTIKLGFDKQKMRFHELDEVSPSEYYQPTVDF
jgi:replicative DNA helicase